MPVYDVACCVVIASQAVLPSRLIFWFSFCTAVLGMGNTGQAYLRCVCAALNFDVGEIWSWRSDEDAQNGEMMHY